MYLCGLLQAEEVEAVVRGSIPAWLRGTLVFNGGRPAGTDLSQAGPLMHNTHAQQQPSRCTAAGLAMSDLGHQAARVFLLWGMCLQHVSYKRAFMCSFTAAVLSTGGGPCPPMCVSVQVVGTTQKCATCLTATALSAGCGSRVAGRGATSATCRARPTKPTRHKVGRMGRSRLDAAAAGIARGLVLVQTRPRKHRRCHW